MKISEFKKLIREEVRNVMKEGKIEIGAKVKITSPELSDYNKIGIVQDEAPSGKFYMVKMKSGLAYFHEADLRVIN